MAFSHLHVHTQYSILDGQSSIKELFDKCVEYGMPALAITDHGNMYGVKVFMNTAKKYPQVKPIIGCEVYVTDHYDHHLKDPDHRKYYHLILLAKNPDGYRNLMKIVTEGHVEGKYYEKPRVSHEIIEKYHENLICSSACIAGELPRNIISGDMDKARQTIKWFKNLFGDDYYLEVMLHKSELTDIPAESYAKLMELYERQKQVADAIYMLAEEMNVKVIATNDVHFVNKEDGPAHDCLICINTGTFLDDPDRLRYTQQEYFKTEEQMAAMFPSHPEVISNTQEVVDKIANYSIDRDHVLPKYELEKDFMDNIDFYLEKYKDVIEAGKYSVSKNKATGEETKTYRGDEFCNSVAFLCYKTYQGASAPFRYGDSLSEEQTQRLDFELKTISRMGFPDYFLIVQDYIAASRKEGYYVGPGRGSAAGSAVAYCLGITNMDPIKYNLLFERFLNPDRISMPDIDVDFENLPVAHSYVEEKYSKSHVSRVITFGTMAAKSAIKDVARISRLPLDESNRLSKLVPDKLSEKVEKEYPFNPKLDELKPGFKVIQKEVEVPDPDNDGATVKEVRTFQTGKEEVDVKNTLKNCYRLVPEFINEFENGSEQVKQVLTFASKLEGSIRQVGVHACATIIGRDNLSDFIPLSTAKDKETGEEVLISQYDGHYIEEVGMLKMDFLGLNTLSIIKECIINIRKRRGEDVNIDEIPIDDAATYKLYERGDTDNVFQFESPGMKKWLQKLHPSRFEDLIAMNALYRPGPMDYIPDFVDRKLGLAKIEYDIDQMSKYLSETYGITVYQEQVMQLSQLLANFTKGEADKLRKAMGKKQIDILNSLKGKFMEEGIKNGHPEKILDKIWKDWEKFAQYAFNKSHATCYAWVSYQTGYLKCHYTPEFLAANLTCNLSKMEEIKMIMADCKAHKIKVLNPDVNESVKAFTVNADGNIRFALSGIKGFGDNVVKAILDERESGGLFTDLFDFVERMHSIISRKTLECLLYSGALDSFGYSRPQYLLPLPSGELFIDALARYAGLYGKDSFDSTVSLFGDSQELKPTRPEVPAMKGDADLMDLLSKEKELVGMHLSSHPLDVYRLEISAFTSKDINFLNLDDAIKSAQAIKKQIDVTLAGYVLSVDMKTSMNGKQWAEVVIEDFEGAYRLVLRGKEYENFLQYFKPQHALLIEGKIGEKFFRKPEERKTLGDPDYAFKINKITLLSNVMNEKAKGFVLWLDAESADKRTAIVNLLKQNKGVTPLLIYLFDPKTQHIVEFASHKFHVCPNGDMTDALDALGVKWKILQ